MLKANTDLQLGMNARIVSRLLPARIQSRKFREQYVPVLQTDFLMPDSLQLVPF
jgi:hypothetical protein